MIAVLSVGLPAFPRSLPGEPYVLLAGPAYSLLSALAIVVRAAVTRVRGPRVDGHGAASDRVPD